MAGLGPLPPTDSETSFAVYAPGLPTCLWESDENHVKALAAREAEARLAQLEPTSKGKPQGSATPNAFALLGPAGASSVDGSKTDLAAQLRALPAASGRSTLTRAAA